MDWYLNAAGVAPDGLSKASGYHDFEDFLTARAGDVAHGDNVIFCSDIDDDVAAGFLTLPVALNLVSEYTSRTLRSVWSFHRAGVGATLSYVGDGTRTPTLRFISFNGTLGGGQSSVIDFRGMSDTNDGLPHVYGCLFYQFRINLEDVADLRVASNLFYPVGLATENLKIAFNAAAATSSPKIRVMNNTFGACTSDAIGIYEAAGLGPGICTADSIIIKNNLAYSPARYFAYFNLVNVPGTVRPDKNTIFNCGSDIYKNDSGVAAIVPGDGDSVADPLCTNPGAGDYTIGLDSPCFNSGANEIDDPGDVPSQDFDGVGLAIWNNAPRGCFNVDKKQLGVVWELYNSVCVFEVEYGGTIESLGTDPAFTGTRKAWITAFLTEFTALWVTVQSKINSQVAAVNAIRSLFSLAPMGAVTIAGANHKAKCLSWANATDTVTAATNDCIAAVGSIPAGQKTDAANALIQKIFNISLELETLAKKFMTNVNFLLTII